MLRLIDCTYLHSVKRCLQGEATHIDDLANFLRAVGEILLADQLIFTADKKGPVYGPAVTAILELEAAIGSANFVKHFETSKVDYRAACEQAAADISLDIKSLTWPTDTVGSVSPVFEDAVEDPDRHFWDDLSAHVRKKKSKPLEPAVRPANIARYILSRPRVVEALRNTQLLDKIATPTEFLRLTAAARSIAYREIGTRIGATYLPATSRAKLLPASCNLSADKLATLPLEIGKPGPSFSLATAVDAIVRTSNGKPEDILRRAWQSRSVMLPMREFIMPSIQGDFLGSSFKRVSNVRKLAKEFESIVEADEGPCLMDALEIGFVLFAIPTLNISGEKLRVWFDRKKSLRRVGKFADLVRDAKPIEAVPAYQNLLRWASYKNGILKITNFGSGDGTPRLW